MKIFLYIQAAISVLIVILHDVAKLLGSTQGGEYSLHAYTVSIICLSAIWIHDAVVTQKTQGERK